MKSEIQVVLACSTWEEKITDMGKIILSYSKYHYDPELGKTIHGTGYIASHLWKYLGETYPNGELIYCDYNESNKLRGIKDVELFIGLSNNFQKMAKILNPEISILWSVNKAAVLRQNIVRYSKQIHQPPAALASEDGIFANLRETQRANMVITLGGWSNYKSFTEIGFGDDEVYPLGIGYLSDSEERSYRQGKNIMMFVGTISLRKGAHFLRPILHFLTKKHPGIKLILVGRTQNEYWNHELSELEILFKPCFLWIREFIEPGTFKWEQIFNSCSFAIFPSFEEGSAGTVVQVIQEGLPVLYSDESGLEFVGNAPVLRMNSEGSWLHEISNFLRASKKTLKDLHHQQQLLLAQNGSGLTQIGRVISRIKMGSLWPSLGININTEFSGNPEFIAYHHGFKNLSSGNSTITINASEKMDVDELSRLGVFTLDRYPGLNKLEVRNLNESTGVIVALNSFRENNYCKEIINMRVNYDRSITGRKKSMMIAEISQFIFRLRRKLLSLKKLQKLNYELS